MKLRSPTTRQCSGKYKEFNITKQTLIKINLYENIRLKFSSHHLYCQFVKQI